ncbi:MAG: prepilin-type N-terminal cleavage/methylation domain-containing protein [Opitutae bacterium]|nr:prepilin-type N-terminal cleavage/methylation domain-containing protein [Opitutae bacterium]
MKSRTKSTDGFTLMEVLLAITLMGLLLTALLTFMFSMGEIWGRGSEERLFVQHVNAVTRHLESLLRRASLPKAGVVRPEPFFICEVRGKGAGRFAALGFVLLERDRLMAGSVPPAPDIHCALAIEDAAGLSLFWRSELEAAEEDEMHSVEVSPLATRLEFGYFDEKADRWRFERTPLRVGQGVWQTPEQIRLQFRHKNLVAERIVTLPLVLNGRAAF